MKVVTLCVAVLCAAVAVSASASGVLAPAELESFLESGAHTDAEIDAMAQAELATMLDDTSEAEEDASAEAQAAAESEMDMPRDTKQQAAVERSKARAAAAAAAAAAKPPVPPPKGDAVQSALAGVPGGDDIIRLVYDELTRLGSVASGPASAVTGAPSTSPLGITDPRIRTLESRLSEMERVRASAVAKQKDATISALTTRLAGLDKTLTELKRSSAQQKELTDRLLAVAKAKEAKADAGTPVDYSVSYEKATLPADFEDQVAAILKSVKTEARKIYEKRCRTCKRKTKNNATPKTYPSEDKPAPAPAAGPKATHKKLVKKAGAAGAAAEAEGPSMDAAPSAAPEPKQTAVHKSGKPKKLLFSPIVTGKEPTPEGMRLSKALNDISLALPVTPAYQLSSKEKALHDVLGESAVNPKFKTPRL